MNIQQALQQAVQTFAETSPSANLDAQVLLSHVLKCNSAHLIAWPEKKLNEQQEENFLYLVKQRTQGIPVAHLTEEREFWSLTFKTNDTTLIPRPETETLIEFILEKFSKKENLKVLDMGTGTGAIAISLAHEKPDWNIYASDISPAALTLAKENSIKLNTSNITFIESNWFENITQDNFDIIVSNPPYIAEDDPHLQIGDVRFEPHSALTAGEIGMDDIEHLCAQAKHYLLPHGYLIIEHGYNQNQLVNDCFVKSNFTDIAHHKDLSGHIRLTAGKQV